MSLPLVFAFIETVRRWAASVPAVRAVALAGSHAAGRARPDSDVDLVVLCDDPGSLLADRAWLAEFGEAAAVTVEDWGAVTSLRVRYAGGPEVEWGLGRPSWAARRRSTPGRPGWSRRLQAVVRPGGTARRTPGRHGRRPA